MLSVLAVDPGDALEKVGLTDSVTGPPVEAKNLEEGE